MGIFLYVLVLVLGLARLCQEWRCDVCSTVNRLEWLVVQGGRAHGRVAWFTQSRLCGASARMTESGEGMRERVL